MENWSISGALKCLCQISVALTGYETIGTDNLYTWFWSVIEYQ